MLEVQREQEYQRLTTSVRPTVIHIQGLIPGRVTEEPRRRNPVKSWLTKQCPAPLVGAALRKPQTPIGSQRSIVLPLPIRVRLKLSAKLLRTIDAHREATGDQGIGCAVERDILNRELADLALEWMMNPQSPRVPNLSRIR